MFADMRRGSFVIATILCTPFLGVLIVYLAALSLGDRCPHFITLPLLYAMVWLTGWLVVVAPILALVCASVLAGWLQKSKTRFELVATGIYSAVMLLHIGYVAWFHLTRQQWDL